MPRLWITDTAFLPAAPLRDYAKSTRKDELIAKLKIEGAHLITDPERHGVIQQLSICLVETGMETDDMCSRTAGEIGRIVLHLLNDELLSLGSLLRVEPGPS